MQGFDTRRLGVPGGGGKGRHCGWRRCRLILGRVLRLGGRRIVVMGVDVGGWIVLSVCDVNADGYLYGEYRGRW